MQDENSGWAVSDEGKILTTTIGPTLWKDVTPPQAPTPTPGLPPLLPAAFFLNANQAWVAYPASQGLTQVLFTTNRGQTWQISAKLPALAFGEPVTPIAFSFLNASTGWLWTQVYPGMHHVYAAIYKTNDGGHTWNIVFDPRPSADVPNTGPGGSYSKPFGPQVFVANDLFAAYAGTGTLSFSADGGQTWAPVKLPELPKRPALTREYVYVGPPSFITAKSGVTPLLLYEFDQVNLPPGDLFFGLPAAGYLLISRSYGLTWTAQPAPARLGSLSRLSQFNVNDCWFLGKDDPSPLAPSTLWVSNDGCENWYVVNLRSELPMGSQMQFVNPDTGFAIPPGSINFSIFAPFDSRLEGSYFFTTQNGGKTWQKLQPKVEVKP